MLKMITVATVCVTQLPGTPILDGSTGGDDHIETRLFSNTFGSFDDCPVRGLLVIVIVCKSGMVGVTCISPCGMKDENDIIVPCNPLRVIHQGGDIWMVTIVYAREGAHLLQRDIIPLLIDKCI